MSWLLAASIPGWLILATFGLERLESAIDDRDADDEVAEMIERAETVARAPRPMATVAPAATGAIPAIDDEPALPTRWRRQVEADLRANPQFRPTRHANRV